MKGFLWLVLTLLLTACAWAQVPGDTAPPTAPPAVQGAAVDEPLAAVAPPPETPASDPAGAAVPAPATPDGLPYVPPTPGDRVDWFTESSLGPPNWAAGAFVCGFWTAFNQPEEYGGTAAGFAERLAVRQSGVLISSGMEAGLGSLWGEDPRYFRHGRGKGFWPRVGWAMKTSFVAYDRSGHLRPAYARYAAAFGNNFITNAWRPDSDNDPGDAVRRGFAGLLGRDRQQPLPGVLAGSHRSPEEKVAQLPGVPPRPIALECCQVLSQPGRRRLTRLCRNHQPSDHGQITSTRFSGLGSISPPLQRRVEWHGVRLCHSPDAGKQSVPVRVSDRRAA